jgi:hypothetical protein
MATKIVRYLEIPKISSNRLQCIVSVPKTKLTNFCQYRYEISNNSHIRNRNFSINYLLSGSAGRAETTSTTQGLSKLQAQELVLRLNGEERNILISALQEYQSKLVKDEYEAESVPRPSNRNLVDMAIANSIPFIGFGFLDNFFMLIFVSKGNSTTMADCDLFSFSGGLHRPVPRLVLLPNDDGRGSFRKHFLRRSGNRNGLLR